MRVAPVQWHFGDLLVSDDVSDAGAVRLHL